MKTQGNTSPGQGQDRGGRITQELRRIREACANSNSESENSDTSSDTASGSTAPIQQSLSRPPLVKQYYNRELKKWLPTSLGPDTARQVVLGEEEEEEEPVTWNRPGEHRTEGEGGGECEQWAKNP